MGSSKKEVEDVFGQPEIMESSYYYFESELRFDFDKNETVEFIEFLGGIDGALQPELYGVKVFEVEADELYINDWWDRLLMMKTYFHSLNRPAHGLARYGITLIPPESLSMFQDIVISDKRINEDENLVMLANKIQEAIERKKYMIHFGV